jgi:hypothetical protein
MLILVSGVEHNQHCSASTRCVIHDVDIMAVDINGFFSDFARTVKLTETTLCSPATGQKKVVNVMSRIMDASVSNSVRPTIVCFGAGSWNELTATFPVQKRDRI